MPLPFEYAMHWPSVIDPDQARHLPVAVEVEAPVSASRARAGTAAAATASAPTAANRRTRVFAIVMTDLSPETSSTLTIACRAVSRSQVVPAGLLQQAAPIGLERHQVTEQGVIFVSLLHR